VIPTNTFSSVHLDERGTVIDNRLSLAKSVRAGDQDNLWNLRILFKWAEEAKAGGDGRLRWLGKRVVDKLKATIEERMRESVEL